MQMSDGRRNLLADCRIEKRKSFLKTRSHFVSDQIGSDGYDRFIAKLTDLGCADESWHFGALDSLVISIENMTSTSFAVHKS